MANLTPGQTPTQASSPAEAQTFEAAWKAAALWILDLGVSAAEARRWATADPGHPAASCLDLIDLMETLAAAA